MNIAVFVLRSLCCICDKVVSLYAILVDCLVSDVAEGSKKSVCEAENEKVTPIRQVTVADVIKDHFV